MKGRIIGREGRNIRALEKLTGVDVIIDETPSAVVLSSFDGVRREIARITLERLIADGRIHPGADRGDLRARAQGDVEARIARGGREGRARGARPRPRPGAARRLLGQLRFRTSYGQNVLDHLVECSHLAGADGRRARGLGRDGAAGGAPARHRQGGHPRGRGPARPGRRPDRPPPRRARGGRPRDRGAPQRGRAEDGRGRDRPGRRRRLRARGRAPAATRSSSTSAGCATSRRSRSRHQGVERVFAMRAGREVRVVVDPGAVDDEARGADLARDRDRDREGDRVPGPDQDHGDPREPGSPRSRPEPTARAAIRAELDRIAPG